MLVQSFAKFKVEGNFLRSIIRPKLSPVIRGSTAKLVRAHVARRPVSRVLNLEL
jgi:hypothetical protein